MVDICNCEECLTEDEEPKVEIKKKEVFPTNLKEMYEARDLNVGFLGEPSRKFD